MSERLPTTADTTVKDTCPSRHLDPEAGSGGEIQHCEGARAHTDRSDGQGVRHYVPGWQWTDAGAMPDDRPCDRRCAQCVGRTRHAVLDAAIAWYDAGDGHTKASQQTRKMALVNAIYEYRKVMGR